MAYYVYMLRCSNDAIYTGITTDPERRFAEHSGKNDRGAKFTRMFRPVKFERIWKTEEKSDALRLEMKIKRLSRKQKHRLIAASDEEIIDSGIYEKYTL